MTEARVLIVEDEVIVAEALKRHLTKFGYQVIGHALDGREAVQIARALHPDVVLMDIVLRGDTDGIEAARSIQCAIETSIIFVTGQSTDTVIYAAARAGALGYVVKPFQIQQVASSIEIALHRRNDVRALDDRGFSRGEAVAALALEDVCVTQREKQLIRGLMRYRRLGRVASSLGISVHTARNHLKSIFRKLNLHSQDELLEFLDGIHPTRFD
jgi:DNA-binding NarL/FixJ family response regulator